MTNFSAGYDDVCCVASPLRTFPLRTFYPLRCGRFKTAVLLFRKDLRSHPCVQLCIEKYTRVFFLFFYLVATGIPPATSAAGSKSKSASLASVLYPMPLVTKKSPPSLTTSPWGRIVSTQVNKTIRFACLFTKK
mmetsp:Transcript_11318/g.15862  ORF Transcript_11318/g.15862 Transcript_11318/m.15862 type:complete len:134 (-) Transcript_11318:946-1347(-)